MKKLAAVGAAIAGTSAFLFLGSAPAQAVSFQEASPLPVDPGIGSGVGTGVIYLEVEREGVAVERETLFCPGGEGHRQGEAACMHLTGAEGLVEEVAPADGLCTKEYAPVTLRAFGVWEGRFVHYAADYDNFCTGLLATGGSIFDIAA
jgi:hypothetical protein